MNLKERLSSKTLVDTETGCWEFTGHRTRSGYGQIGRGARTEGVAYAHRVAYEEAFGPIPDGLQVDHLCRNRGCVNPEHLEAVTQRVNLVRGDGWAGVNAKKSACKRGHKFTPENTRHDGRGRQCRTCDTIRRAA